MKEERYIITFEIKRSNRTFLQQQEVFAKNAKNAKDAKSIFMELWGNAKPFNVNVKRLSE